MRDDNTWVCCPDVTNTLWSVQVVFRSRAGQLQGRLHFTPLIYIISLLGSERLVGTSSM